MIGRLLLSLTLLGAAAGGASAKDAPPASLSTELAVIHRLRARGEYDQALLRASRLVADHPESLAAHVAYQDLRLARGEGEALRRLYREAATGEDATADDLYLYARLLDGRRALPVLRRALKLDPRHYWALCALGNEYAKRHRPKDAEKALILARKVDPDSPVAVNALGWLAESGGDLGKAEMYYREALVLDERFVPALINLGLLLVRKGGYKEAEKVLERARLLAPADPMPLIGIGMARAANHDPIGALVFYKKAVALDSLNVVSLNLLFSMYLRLGHHDLARAALDRALRADPVNETTLLNMAYLELSGGRPSLALTWAAKALDAHPESAYAWYFRGLCLEYGGDAKGAEKAYRKAAGIDKGNPDYPRALGALYASGKRWREALRAYAKAAELAGETPASLMDLAFAYLGAGDARRAARLFEKVLKAEPGNLDAWMNLGLLYQEKLKDRGRARKAYREYLRRGGRDPRVRTWLEELDG